MTPRLRFPLAAPTSAALVALTLMTPSAFAQGQGPGAARTGAPAKGPARPAPADPAVSKAQGAGGAAAKTEQPPRAVVDPAAARKMDELLVRWEAKSKKVRSLAVSYTRVDYSPLFKEKKTYQGMARLQSPDFVYLDFNEVQDGKAATIFSERIVCDGKNVYQFVGLTRKIWVYPLAQNPQDKALNQGPLPFLFDMTVAKAKNRYQMIFLKENEREIFIQIIPKLQLDREEFSQAMVRMDKERLQPLDIRLWSPGGGNETKTFSFAPDAFAENREIAPTWFDGEAMIAGLTRNKKEGWNAVRNPDPNGRPQNGSPPVRQNPPAVGARPAPKGAANRQR